MKFEANILKKERNGMSDFSNSLINFLISFPISQEIIKRTKKYKKEEDLELE